MQKTTIDYLKSLKKNNNKEWFEQNKSSFELAKSDFLQLVDRLIVQLTKIDSRYGDLKAKDCIFRQYRDIRFSKDKTPYKTNMGAAFHLDGKKGGKAAFYFHLEPGNSFVGGGLWMPDAEKLKKVRQEIDYNFEKFKKIVSHKSFVETFGALSTEDQLKNAPKGYENDHKAIAFLRLKSYVAAQPLSDKELTDAIEKKIGQSFKAIAPFIHFLNESIG